MSDNWLITINYTFIDVQNYLNWFENYESADIKDLVKLPGAQVLQQLINKTAVLSELFDLGRTLQTFWQDSELIEDKVGLNIAFQKKDYLKQLYTHFSSFDIKGDLKSMIQPFMPIDCQINFKTEIVFSILGLEHGDAMVINIRKTDGEYKLDPNGHPIIIINLAKMLEYGDNDIESTVDVTQRILAHE